MKTHIWSNREGQTFESKADAFEWMNSAQGNPDMPVLYCEGELRYQKTPFGIFDQYQRGYVKGDLPVERYQNL